MDILKKFVFILAIGILIINATSCREKAEPLVLKESYGKELKHAFINYAAITRDSVAQYEQLAAKGDADAMFMLAHCYARGLWCKQDSMKAMTLLREAAVAGDYDAQMRMCEIYYGADHHLRKYAVLDYSNPSNVQKTKELADNGLAWAQDLVGEFHDQGVGGYKEDPKKAMKWYVKSSNQGFGWGQVNICSHIEYLELESFEDKTRVFNSFASLAAKQGCRSLKDGLDYYYSVMHDDSFPVNDSFPVFENRPNYDINKDSLDVYKARGEKGDALGELKYGWCCLNGIGIEQNVEEGLSLIRRSAQKGEPNANRLLGDFYRNGNYGLTKNNEEAEWHFYQSAMQGNKKALLRLGELSTNSNEYIDLFNQAYIRDSTDLQTIELIGKIYFDKNRAGDALFFLSRAVELGSKDNRVKYCLAQCYYNGWGGAAINYSEALQLFSETEQTTPAAKTYIGLCYENGANGAQDITTAIDWYQKGIAAKDALAFYRLGLCYEYGRGVGVDMGKAAEYYHQAAERGNAASSMRLAQCYEKGNGVPKDSIEAIKWNEKAADQGNEYAQEKRAQLTKAKFEEVLTPSHEAFFNGFMAILDTPRSWSDSKFYFAIWLKKVNIFVLLLVTVLLCVLLWKIAKSIIRYCKPKNRFVGKEYIILNKDESDETWLFSDNRHLLVTDKEGTTKEYTYSLEKNGQLRINNYRNHDIALLTLERIGKIVIDDNKIKDVHIFKLDKTSETTYLFLKPRKITNCTYNKVFVSCQKIREEKEEDEYVDYAYERLKKRKWLLRYSWIGFLAMVFIVSIIAPLAVHRYIYFYVFIVCFIIPSVGFFLETIEDRIKKRIRERYRKSRTGKTEKDNQSDKEEK